MDNGRIVDEKVPLEKNEFIPDVLFDHFRAVNLTGVENPLVKFEDASIRSLDGSILNHLSWEIRVGEKWILKGDNGVGKSTLLSFLYADHPQAYAIPFTIFGRDRTSGMTIWDIKKRIGFVSSELHNYFVGRPTLVDLIRSRTTYGEHNPMLEQDMITEHLITFFGIDRYRDKPYHQLPSGIQRLGLLLRALHHNPPLLLLDEPFQGMDEFMIARSLLLIEKLFGPYHTLILVSHYQDKIPEIFRWSKEL